MGNKPAQTTPGFARSAAPTSLAKRPALISVLTLARKLALMLALTSALRPALTTARLLALTNAQ